MTDATSININSKWREELELFSIKTRNGTKVENCNGLNHISVYLSKKDVNELYHKLSVHLGFIDKSDFE
jgi:hypothetical protein